MKGMDGMDGEMLYGDITKAVIGCAFEVSNELGCGFLESVYENALLMLLRQRGFSVKSQCPIKVMFRGECVGDFIGDILVDDNVLLELKAVKVLAPEHHAQIINYLNATGIQVGLLINFGPTRLEFDAIPGIEHPIHPLHPC